MLIIIAAVIEYFMSIGVLNTLVKCFFFILLQNKITKVNNMLDI